MLTVALGLIAALCSGPAAVCPRAGADSLPLVERGATPAMLTDPADAPAVRHAAAEVAGDLARVAGGGAHVDRRYAIVVGTIGHNATIDRLVREHRIDVGGVRGRWEASLTQVVEHPAPGIARALVIAGADRRGAVFGAYDLSRRAGVSPWAWWADVPVTPRAHLAVGPGARVDAPGVRYRGIFLNDEDPALKGWAEAKFGGVNHLFYAHVFDLILRLRGNYLWPAMWGKSLWEDDPQSAVLADQVGLVLGTTHHEPMMRAQADWHRANGGAWNYDTNGPRLRAFWREGIQRNQGRDYIATVGMRGDGDEPMTQGTAIPLLERIVADQRKIIAEVTGKPADQTPQLWALYKEVQDYYDQGMTVPDDVTLLFSDDNWGNIRRLPEPGAAPRAGGAGVYYHFDYVGGPRNYKWLNVTQIGRVGEQMHLAHVSGANRIWVTNVGDLKPMELPISFFLDLAWNPDGWAPDASRTYTAAWAAEQFGPENAAAIADILDRETRYAARRTPELTNADTWTLDGEWPRVITDYDRLVADAQAVGRRLPAAAQDAYFELVLHPVLATANLHHVYYAVAENHRAFAAHDPAADRWADEAERRFAADRAIAARYEASAGGKWPHMMDQTHFGYVTWRDPKTDVMPPVYRLGQTAPVADTPPSPLNPPARPGPVVAEAAVDAVHARALPGAGGRWVAVTGLGRVGSSMMTLPQARAFTRADAPALAFDVDLAAGGTHRLTLVAAPSLPTSKAARLRCLVSVDGGPDQQIDLADTSDRDWASAVIAHARVAGVARDLAPGRHRIEVRPLDANLVLERLEVTRAPVDPLALDPVETALR